MADAPIPLYVGIPLAMLCVGASIFVVALAVAIWKDTRK